MGLQESLTKEFYSTEEIAELLGLHYRNIYMKITGGDIKAYKVGNRWRVTRSDLMSFIERETN